MSSNSGTGGGHGASLKSWLAATVIVIGFIVGGVALIYWNWPAFWIGVGIAVVGSVLAAAVGIMNEVTEYGGGSAGTDPQSSSY
ncbi:MAG: hypothetical protein QOC82_697 [Frankiaceae bacterium]|nr:hypothetical protein [Frankiaceae bacterium]MDQ1698694.1 hypothetical protein [Frankiaceae bacterium]